MGKGTPNFAELAALRVQQRNLLCDLNLSTLNKVFEILGQPTIQPPMPFVLEITGGQHNCLVAEFRFGDNKLANAVIYQTKHTKPFLDHLRKAGIVVNTPHYLE